MAGSCEHRNEPSGSIKCWEIRCTTSKTTSKLNLHAVDKDLKNPAVGEVKELFFASWIYIGVPSLSSSTENEIYGRN
jgi:hypothetical protein